MSNMTTTSVNLTKKDPNPINLTDGAAEKVAELIAADPDLAAWADMAERSITRRA